MGPAAPAGTHVCVCVCVCSSGDGRNLNASERFGSDPQTALRVCRMAFSGMAASLCIIPCPLYKDTFLTSTWTKASIRNIEIYNEN